MFKNNGKIVFIVPGKTVARNADDCLIQRLRTNVSLQALSILGALEENGFDVAFIDASAEGYNLLHEIDHDTLGYGLTAQDISNRCAEMNANVCLISSIFTFEQMMVNDIVCELKRSLPLVPVIIGGIHASLKPEWHFEDSDPDFIVIGEGEETVVELIKELSLGNPDPRKVNGIAIRNGNGFTPVRDRLCKLDRLWAMTSVLRKPDGKLRYTERLCRKHSVYISDEIGEDVGTFSLYGSRGCRFKCEYCPTTLRDGAMVRHMTADHMFAQFMTARTDFDVRVFANQADSFGVEPEGLEFLRKIRNYRRVSGDRSFVLNNPNAFFLRQFFPSSKKYKLDTDFLDLLQKAGFNTITVAVETLAARFNKKVNWDKLNPQDVIDLCDEIRRRGMKTDIYMMFGFPDQAKEEFDLDLKFAEQLMKHVDLVSWNGATLLPGTAYYQAYIEVDKAKEAEYRKVMRSGYSWHFPLDTFNLSRVPTERFRASIAPFGQSWL